MSNYHSRIMNIQTYPEVENLVDNQRILYKSGHRDARHAAAEIVLEAEQEIKELKEKIRYLEQYNP